jgi:hypothetical protein
MTGGQKGYAVHNHITFLKSFYIKQPTYLQKLNGEKLRDRTLTLGHLSVILYKCMGLILDASHEKG